MNNIKEEIDSPLVSILMPAYNHEKFVVEAVESVYKQTYKNFELIVVNDGSRDETYNILERLQEKYHFTLLNQENQGITKTLNRALKNSKGDYITLLASDDRYRSDFLSSALQIFRSTNTELGFVYSDALLIKNDGSPRYGLFIQRAWDFTDPPEGDIYPQLIERNFIPAMTVMIPRKILVSIGGFDEELKHEDYDLWLRISAHFPVAYNHYISAEYRLHETNTHKSMSSLLVKDSLEIFWKNLTLSDKYRNLARDRFMRELKHLYIENPKICSQFLKNKNLSSVVKRNSLLNIKGPRTLRKLIAKLVGSHE